MSKLHHSGPNPGGKWNDGTQQSSSQPVANKAGKKYREYGLRPERALQRFCRELGGANPFGGPMYRLSWAPAQLSWMAGKWRIDDKHGNFSYFKVFAARGPKYPQAGERWILETWKPPEAYGSPYEWECQTKQIEDTGEVVDRLGPYPCKGDYEMCFLFQTDDTKEFVGPTYTLCERRIQEHLRMSKKRSLLLAMVKETRDYEEFSKRREQSDILSEPFDGLNSVLTPYVSLAGVDVPPAAPAAISTTQEVS